MSEIRTGCISWTYPDWIGTFYPSSSKSGDFLALYSRIFDIVEVDSSFYRSPSAAMVNQWRRKTPEHFLFTVKLPKKISHDRRLVGVEEDLQYFQNSVKLFEHKLAAVVVQLPPFFRYDESTLNVLDRFLSLIDTDIRYSIEFRSKSWFREETYKLLRSREVSFVWSVNEYVEGMPKEVTTDFVYLRFMGEFGKLKRLDRIQIDRTDLLKGLWKDLREAISKVKNAYVLFSNHFAGFAPETVNQFRSIAGLDPVDWKKVMERATPES